MSVQVIFSDGSKQLAHNNDDLRERWELRRDVDEGVITQESSLGYAIPIPNDGMSYEELQQYRAGYVQMINALHVRKKILNRQWNMRAEYNHVSLVYGEVHGAMANVKNQIREWNIKLDADRDVSIRQYTHQLEAIILAHSLELPPPPHDGWKVSGCP